jgi:putative ABC transport system ATP-binding protein
MKLIETRNVAKVFRAGSKEEVRALRGVSISIPQGTFAALTGASGSGKTTLLALLGALDRPTSGQVLHDGDDLAVLSDFELARRRRRIGFVFQNFSLLPGLEVWNNVTYPLIPRGIPARQRYELAAQQLKRLGLADKMSKRPEELSGGEQQRVAIARALAGQPQALLADEPTSNLDRKAAGLLRALLAEIHAQGTTVVVATHDAELLAVATTVYDLEAGRLKTGADACGASEVEPPPAMGAT